MSEPLLQVDDLRKAFVLHDGRKLHAVRNVSFVLHRGETLGLVGESGSGKSTVGRCILKLQQPDGGRIWFDGSDLTALGPKQMLPYRPRIQIVFQDPFSSLNAHMRIHDIITEPLRLHTKLTRNQQEARVAGMIERVGLDQSVSRYFPGDITASEQQRVGIARAFICEPQCVVLDEPTSALDPRARSNLLALLSELQLETGAGYLFISHDMNSIAKISDRIAVMYLGSLVESGPAQAVLTNQKHPYSMALLSSVLYPDPARPPHSYGLEGEIPSAIGVRDECPLVGRCPIRQPDCASEYPLLRTVGPGRQSACRYHERLGSIS
ncbi:MAG: ATP-binding cassette domain-containing protein [Aestuariivita sp.]|nr:ATP-binding cassette domain-containing protein [Aestuariivita sp.]MCY4203616.1 ATP-binding cassette domain-containing protein [Aestuariivita sp.]MCY4288952.1 ATP-binding cassette domain-containing protein [Aestuariivita sp.]MCY4346193.1 ATP-binding cassette domain-containing protein [Aestuariivita sp.]